MRPAPPRPPPPSASPCATQVPAPLTPQRSARGIPAPGRRRFAVPGPHSPTRSEKRPSAMPGALSGPAPRGLGAHPNAQDVARKHPSVARTQREAPQRVPDAPQCPTEAPGHTAGAWGYRRACRKTSGASRDCGPRMWACGTHEGRLPDSAGVVQPVPHPSPRSTAPQLPVMPPTPSSKKALAAHRFEWAAKALEYEWTRGSDPRPGSTASSPAYEEHGASCSVARARAPTLQRHTQTRLENLRNPSLRNASHAGVGGEQHAAPFRPGNTVRATRRAQF